VFAGSVVAQCVPAPDLTPQVYRDFSVRATGLRVEPRAGQVLATVGLDVGLSEPDPGDDGSGFALVGTVCIHHAGQLVGTSGEVGLSPGAQEISVGTGVPVNRAGNLPPGHFTARVAMWASAGGRGVTDGTPEDNVSAMEALVRRPRRRLELMEGVDYRLGPIRIGIERDGVYVLEVPLRNHGSFMGPADPGPAFRWTATGDGAPLEITPQTRILPTLGPEGLGRLAATVDVRGLDPRPGVLEVGVELDLDDDDAGGNTRSARFRLGPPGGRAPVLNLELSPDVMYLRLPERRPPLGWIQLETVGIANTGGPARSLEYRIELVEPRRVTVSEGSLPAGLEQRWMIRDPFVVFRREDCEKIFRFQVDAVATYGAGERTAPMREEVEFELTRRICRDAMQVEIR
jgi:hypothetical protein